MPQSDNWQSAAREVHEVMASNGEFLNTLYKVAERNESSTKQQRFEEALHEARVARDSSEDAEIDLEFLKTTARTIQKDFGALNIEEFVDERMELSQDFDNNRRKFHSINRSFTDIAMDGPQNAVEETLLVAAMAYLEPVEFERAVAEGLSPNEVSGRIANSKIKRLSDAIMTEEALDNQSLSKEAELAQAPNVLGASMGVLDSIQQSLESTNVLEEAKAGEPKTPSHTPNNKDAEPGRNL